MGDELLQRVPVVEVPAALWASAGLDQFSSPLSCSVGSILSAVTIITRAFETHTSALVAKRSAFHLLLRASQERTDLGKLRLHLTKTFRNGPIRNISALLPPDQGFDRFYFMVPRGGCLSFPEGAHTALAEPEKVGQPALAKLGVSRWPSFPRIRAKVVG